MRNVSWFLIGLLLALLVGSGPTAARGPKDPLDRFYSSVDGTFLKAVCGARLGTPAIVNYPLAGDGTYTAFFAAVGAGTVVLSGGGASSQLRIPPGGCDPCMLTVPARSAGGRDSLGLKLVAEACPSEGAQLAAWQFAIGP